MTRGLSGASKVVLCHDGTSHTPTLMSLRRDGSWVVVGVSGSKVKGFSGFRETQVSEFADVPERAVGSAMTYSTRPSGPDEFTPVITRIVGMGPRWQTLTDTDPSSTVFEIDREPYEDLGLPSRLLVDPSGLVRNQSYWKGKPLRLVGLVADEHVRSLSAGLADFLTDPACATGQLLVMADWSGTLATYPGTVRGVIEQAQRLGS